MLAAWPWYSAHSLAQRLQALAADPDPGALQVRELVHESGYLSSHGSLSLRWSVPCAADGAGPALRLHYQVDHVPGWDGAGRFHWTAQPEDGAMAGGLAGIRLAGQGVVGYAGALRTQIALPALRLEQAGRRLQAAPSQASLVLDADALRLDWALEQLATQGSGVALLAQQLHLVLDLHAHSLGLGSLVLQAQQLQGGWLDLQGVQLRAETSAAGERLGVHLSESAQSARLLGQTLDTLQLDLAATDLHAPSLQALARLLGQRCGALGVAASRTAQLRTALRGLLGAGFSLAVTRLQGHGDRGSVDGSLLLQMLPAERGLVSLQQQLQSTAELHIRGELLSPEVRQSALDAGWLQEAPDGALRARLDYRQGALRIGDSPRGGSLLPWLLPRADALLQELLEGGAGLGRETPEPVAVEHPPAEAPDASTSAPVARP